MTEPATVVTRNEGGALTIELNRPERLNAWNAQLGEELLAAVRSAAADESVRAVCLTGAGRAFSSGADLRDAGAAELRENGRPDLSAVLRDRYNPIISALRSMEKPVLAAVNGPAVGIGLSLALAADLIIARESSYFLLAFVNIGLAPDGGASAMVAERIGFARATEMAILGDKVPAPQAADWGLINFVCADEDFADEVAALMTRLSSGATRAQGAIKRQMNAWLLGSLDAQLELEAVTQNEMADTDDFVAGATGFMTRTPPAFRGR